MKSIRLVALTLVALMLFSVIGSLSSLVVEPIDQPIILEEEEVEMFASDPGHVVFSQYITSDNCGFCMSFGSPAHKKLKTDWPASYTYVSLHSADYGNTADAESGNVNPIRAVTHFGETGGAPKTSFGDAPNTNGNYFMTGCGSNICWDTAFSSGGRTHSNVGDYALNVAQSDNGDGTSDITITANYVGAGSAPLSTYTLYGAVTEKVCNSHAYTDGTKGGHCWEAWLLNSGAYVSNSGNVGGGTGFQTISLASGSASASWTVPNSLVSGGSNNMLTVGALYSGWSTSTANFDVFTASDSSMIPLIDIGVETLSLDNPDVTSGYINGDIIDLQAVVKNYGVEEYTDGGDVRFYYKNGNTKNYVGSTQSLSNFASQGSTQTFNGQIDTSTLPESNYQTTFGVEISNLVADALGGDNDETEIVPHDIAPVARKAEVIGPNNIEREDTFLVEAKAGINDGVDINLATLTFEIEVSPTGANQWSGDIVSGGDEIFNEGTSNEHRQYLVQPTMGMAAGDYDLRSRAIDGRGQMSPWEVTENSFALLNALPVITSEPVPTVKVETSTRVSIIANIDDAETDLSDLVITSTSPNFIAWHASSEEVEVYFENIRYVGGNPVASGIEVSVDDGTDVAHGTLLFNVIENGQPRWAGVEKQYVDEASSDLLDLFQYLSDTDSNGEIVTNQDLVLAIVDNTNPEIINVELSGSYLEYETTDDDINGMTIVTVRASDGIQFSDQQITIQITPINDAPRLDISEFEGLRLKVGTQKVIFVDGLLTDVDSDVNEAFLTVTNSVPGAARYNIMDNTITLQWEQAGMQTVTIQSADRYDSNIYTLVVDVYDSAPLLVGEGPDGDVRVLITNLYIDENPVVTMFLNKDDVTITSLTSTWQLCNELTGVCTIQVVHEHDITAKSLGWTYDPFLGEASDGMRMKDQVKLTVIVAIDSEGNKYEFKDAIYWTITEEAPGPETMDDETLAEYIVELEGAIDSKEEYLATLTEGTTEHTEAKEELVELRTDLDQACEFGECTSDAPAGNTAAPSTSMDLTVILIVLSVVILAALAALLFMRGGKKESEDFMVDWANQLPANDAVANSMYGGAGEIFQQPVAAPPAPAGLEVSAGGPPLPEGGLPAGWTMEQWAYYGHQYQQ
jgi:hypothetical protein